MEIHVWKKYQLYRTESKFIMFYQRFMKFYTFKKSTMNWAGWGGYPFRDLASGKGDQNHKD